MIFLSEFREDAQKSLIDKSLIFADMNQIFLCITHVTIHVMIGNENKCKAGEGVQVWNYLMEEGVVSEMCFGYTGSDGTDCSDRSAQYSSAPLSVAALDSFWQFLARPV